jgi:hypothetical protein
MRRGFYPRLELNPGNDYKSYGSGQAKTEVVTYLTHILETTDSNASQNRDYLNEDFRGFIASLQASPLST